MKVLIWIVLLVAGISAFVLLAGQMGWLRGTPPGDLGVVKGRLKPPSLTPNSVSSQANLYPNHPQHQAAYIAPLAWTGTPDAAMQKLTEILTNHPRCILVKQQPGYLYAQCTTALLQFTDDVEFWLDTPAAVIHMRSASRLGKGDLGANRDRMEAIRAQFLKN